MKYTLLSLLLVVFCVSSVSQEVISSSGETNTSTLAEISWTLGEVVTTTATTPTTTLNQGFQQGTLKVSTLLESEESIVLKAYPNPVKDILTIETTEENLKFQVVTIGGEIIEAGEIKSNRYTLNFSNTSKGVYFLIINNKKIYKIIKQ